MILLLFCLCVYVYFYNVLCLSVLQFCVLCMFMLCTFLVFYFCAASHGVIKNDDGPLVIRPNLGLKPLFLKMSYRMYWCFAKFNLHVQEFLVRIALILKVNNLVLTLALTLNICP